MGQCTSCGSTRQLDNSSVPNSPSYEFNPADLFQDQSPFQQCHPAFRDLNTKKEARLGSTLYATTENEGTESEKKFWLGSSGKATIRREQSRKSWSSPSRKKLKTVTFSEPIVKTRTFEPSGKLYLPFKKIRLTSKPKPKRSSINFTLEPNRCSNPNLIVSTSTFEVNGKEVDASDTSEKAVGMGNNTSRSGESQKFSCVTEKSFRSSSSNFKTQSWKDSPSKSSAVPSTSTPELSKSVSSQLNPNSKISANKNELILSNLNLLEANRKQNQLLRDRFFSSQGSVISLSPINAATPEPDMNSNYNSNSRLRSPGLHPQHGSKPVPDKVKRTYQYRSPSVTAAATPVDTNSNEIPKLYSTSTNKIGTQMAPPTHQKLSLSSSPVTAGASRIPGFRIKPNSTSSIRNMSATRTLVSVPSTPTTVNSDSIPRSAEDSLKKSSTCDSNIGSSRDPHRRESAPPKCLPQRRYNTATNVTKVFPIRSPVANQKMTASTEIIGGGERRYTLFNLNSKLTPENSGLKRPVESKPFYTIGLYQFKSARPTTGEFPSLLPTPAHLVRTGVVNARKLDYQPKAEDVPSATMIPQKITPAPTPSQFGLSRSATWVRGRDGEIRPDKESPANMSQSVPAPLSNQPESDRTTESQAKANESEILKMPIEEKQKNVATDSHGASQIHKRQDRRGEIFPLEHTNSVTSTSSILMDGHGDNNVISDSEFLIDDEISDQPELTLTFKDSPLRLSLSSSGESLLSCDLMLDLSLKDSVGPGDPELTSDSAISDVSSSIPTSIGSQSVNSNGHLANSSLPKRMNRTSSPFSSTPLSSKQNTKSTFGYRSTTAVSISPSKQIDTNSKPPFRLQERKPVFGSENKPSLNSTNKSPSHNKSYNRSLPSKRNVSPRFNQNSNVGSDVPSETLKGVELSSQFLLTGLHADVVLLREQLEVLKGVIVEQETIQAGKDETIHRLRKEIEILKKSNGIRKCGESGDGDDDEIGLVNGDFQNRKHSTKYYEDETDSKMINAASQTESSYTWNSDSVHPPELNGRLVSFWIGRRSYSSYNSTITFAT